MWVRSLDRFDYYFCLFVLVFVFVFSYFTSSKSMILFDICANEFRYPWIGNENSLFSSCEKLKSTYLFNNIIRLFCENSFSRHPRNNSAWQTQNVQKQRFDFFTDLQSFYFKTQRRPFRVALSILNICSTVIRLHTIINLRNDIWRMQKNISTFYYIHC